MTDTATIFTVNPGQAAMVVAECVWTLDHEVLSSHQVDEVLELKDLFQDLDGICLLDEADFTVTQFTLISRACDWS